jgi:hypothetical protein
MTKQDKMKPRISTKKDQRGGLEVRMMEQRVDNRKQLTAQGLFDKAWGKS